MLDADAARGGRDHRPRLRDGSRPQHLARHPRDVARRGTRGGPHLGRGPAAGPAAAVELRRARSASAASPTSTTATRSSSGTARSTPVPCFSGYEVLEFPEPIGRLEAFVTSGGLSTSPWTFEGRLKRLENKTLRYPGHVAQFKAFSDLGLLGLDPIPSAASRSSRATCFTRCSRRRSAATR